MSRTVVISGGSKGLGYFLVNKYLSEGYNVSTFSTSSNKNLEILENNTKFHWQQIDASDDESLKKFISSTIEKFKRIDILINNVGYLFEGLLAFTKKEQLNKTISVNINTPVLLAQLCIPSMIKNRKGVILNVSSINAVRGHKGVSIYSVSKAALNGLTLSLARELGPCNIRVNTLCPGYFSSDLVSYLSDDRQNQILKRTPLGRLGTVEDMAEMACFICSDKASFITGQNFIVDGGMTC